MVNVYFKLHLIQAGAWNEQVAGGSGDAPFYEGLVWTSDKVPHKASLKTTAALPDMGINGMKILQTS